MDSCKHGMPVRFGCDDCSLSRMAEVRKDDEALIQQLVDALEGSIAITMVKIDQRNAALIAGRARLEGKP